MTRIVALALAVLFAAAPAAAQADLESQMRQATGRMVVKLLFADVAGARAECEAGKALLTAGTPGYLAAYSEECFAVAAAPAGPGNEKPRCPGYLRAIDIWRVSPPPMDDEDAALQRAGKLKEWKSFAAAHCGVPDETARSDMGPIAPVAPGSRLETEEGVSYLVPDGWTVERFFESSGEAVLRDAGRGYRMRVARVGLNDTTEYTDTEVLPSGGVLEWTHVEFVRGSGIYVTYARTDLVEAYLEIGVSTDANGPPAGVDKDFALELIRGLADSARIVSARRCIGNCGPGRIAAPR